MNLPSAASIINIQHSISGAAGPAWLPLVTEVLMWSREGGEYLLQERA